MLRRWLEEHIARAVVDHPANVGVFDTEPNLVWSPRNISLGFDSAFVQAVLSLRSTRDVSRETVLELVGLDQSTEALRREIEADLFDEIFGTLAMPGQGPDGQPVDPAAVGPNGAGESPQVSGSRGGRPAGGGKPPANPAKTVRKTPAGNTTPSPRGTGK